MNKRDVSEAAAQAKRFLNLSKAVLDPSFQPNSTGTDYLSSSMETAALRRASMDLTRALAKMRKFS